MRFLRRLNPAPGLRDFWTEFSRPNPHRWPVLGVSIALTFTIFYVVTRERAVGLPSPPEVIYISTFEDGRSQEDIVASNIENQTRKEALAKREEERLEVRRELYRQLGKATGLDTDEMERKIREDEAREKAAEAKRRKELLGRAGIEQDEPAATE